MKMKRVGQVIRIRQEKETYSKELHAAAWPGVLDMVKQCNIQNYSIFMRDGFLFAFFEYIGTDYEADTKKMAGDELTQKWWAECMHASNRWNPPRKANGGRIWKKYSDSIDHRWG